MTSPQAPQHQQPDVPPPPGSAGADARSVPVDRERELWRATEPSERELQRMHSGVPIQCQFCVGQTFRRSRLRASDFASILFMRYPVRCLRCAQRQAVSFTVAGISAPSYLRRRDAPAPKANSGSGSRR